MFSEYLGCRLGFSRGVFFEFECQVWMLLNLTAFFGTILPGVMQDPRWPQPALNFAWWKGSHLPELSSAGCAPLRCLEL